MNSSNRAFSLPEVLAVIAVLSIVFCAFGRDGFVHQYQRWQANQASTEQIRRFLSLLKHARALAIRSSQPVLVCGGHDCLGNWSESISLQYEAGSQTIESYTFAPNTRIQWRGFPIFRPYIEFLPSGLASYQNGSFYLCVEQANTRRIIINQSGRAYVDTTQYQAKECL